MKTIEKNSEKSLPNYELSLRKGSNDSIHLTIRVINTVGGKLTKKGSDEDGDLYEVEGGLNVLMIII